MIDRERNEEFEERLAAALRHVDAPAGFAAKVLQAAQEPVHGRVIVWPKRKRWVGAAIAASLLAGSLGGGLYERQQKAEKARLERAKAALAEQQFETAMRVTQRALSRTREHLSRAGVRLSE